MIAWIDVADLIFSIHYTYKFYRKFLKKAVKHHERYKKSFIEEIVNGKHSNIGKGSRKNRWEALHNLI